MDTSKEYLGKANEAIRDTVSQFRDRSRKLKKQSNWFLASVFLALSSGILVFIFASTITEKDIGGENKIDELIEAYNAQIINYQKELDSLELEKKKRAVLEYEPLNSSMDSLKKGVDSVFRAKTSDGFKMAGERSDSARIQDFLDGKSIYIKDTADAISSFSISDLPNNQQLLKDYRINKSLMSFAHEIMSTNINRHTTVQMDK